MSLMNQKLLRSTLLMYKGIVGWIALAKPNILPSLREAKDV